jgi:o-succinylbenzoate---CoA ligase
MGTYPFPSLWINGRLVLVATVIDGLQEPRSAFERNTFEFIQAWFTGKTEFEINTSGSTGEPKKIKISRSQMIASARLTERALNLKTLDTALICIDTKYIGGMMMLVRAFTSGLKIIALDPSANPLQKIPVDQWVNFAAFVPYQIENILESKRPHLLECVDKIIIGGAPLSEGAIKRLQNFQSQFFATYGMTETVSHVALRKLNGKNKTQFFETLPGITIDLDDRECLILNVPYIEGPIVTNDVAEKISPTAFNWKGRFDNIINTGGIKVNPEKVEAAIDAIFEAGGFKSRFFVHGFDDRQLGTRIILVIEANKIDEQFLSTLYSSLAAVISPFEIPKEAYLVETFIETENGKINRLQTVKGIHASFPLKN